ncbi:MAG: SPOR domain-containing protein [Terracidiphilus sp.]
MRGLFDDKEREPVPSRDETELTLGSGMLLAIFFGLVLICGLCFGLGYAAGHRSSPPASAAAEPAVGAAAALQQDNTHPKPTATTRAAADAPPQAAAAEVPAPGDSSANQAAGAQPVTTAVSPSNSSQIRSALAAEPRPIQAAQPAATRVAPALGPSVPYMVQIAAVGGQEDADVLAAALRKRGYAVTLRRDPYDELIHVRIGPFTSAAQAEQWRQKLLSDGYNAIVQQ